MSSRGRETDEHAVATPVPCRKNTRLEKLVRDYAEVLKTEAHTLGSHELDEKDFYNSGLFRGATERHRGQFVATMDEKRTFAGAVLNFMRKTRIRRGGAVVAESGLIAIKRK